MEKISLGLAGMIVGAILALVFGYSIVTQTPIFTTEQLAPYPALIGLPISGLGIVLFAYGIRMFFNGLSGRD